MFKICEVCLSCNIRMYCIENSELHKIYKKLIKRAEIKTMMGKTLNTTICYICYSQLQRCHKFAELALKSQNKLRNLVDNCIEVTCDTILRLNLGTKHNLSITNVPPITVTIKSDTVNARATVKEELIEFEESLLGNDDAIRNYHFTSSLTNNNVQKPIKHTLDQPTLNHKRKKVVHKKGSKAKALNNIKQIKEVDLNTLKEGERIGEATKVLKDSMHTNFLEIKDEVNLASADAKGSQDTSNIECEDDKIDISTLTPNQREEMITKTINNLVDLINIVKPTMIATYNLDCQRVRELKKNKPTMRMPKKRFPWSNRSRFLLGLLVKLAGSEKAGAKLLMDRVLPQFPRGFVRMPTLLKMAGYKCANVAKRQEIMRVESPNPVSETTTTSEEDKTMLLPHIINVFSCSTIQQ